MGVMLDSFHKSVYIPVVKVLVKINIKVQPMESSHGEVTSGLEPEPDPGLSYEIITSKRNVNKSSGSKIGEHYHLLRVALL